VLAADTELLSKIPAPPPQPATAPARKPVPAPPHRRQGHQPPH
jgi:hypothetical protein